MVEKGDVNTAFQYEESDVCRKKANTLPVNIFMAVYLTVIKCRPLDQLMIAEV